MSTNASFVHNAFPELGAIPQSQPSARAVSEEDMRTRPVAVRRTPLVLPDLAWGERPGIKERARTRGDATAYVAGWRAATEALAADRAALRADADRALGVQVEELRSAVDSVRCAAAELHARTATALEGTEESVLSAALEIAGMILGRAIAEDRRGAAVAALRRAIDAAGPAPIGIVRMHPDDLELVGVVAEQEPGLQLAADEHLSRGDAMVDLPDGMIDARIASAVERVRRALVRSDE